jgi:subtilase family serine protease
MNGGARKTRRAAHSVAAAVVLAAVLAVLAASAGSAGAASGRVALQGSVPAWASPGNYVGATSPRAAVGFRVYLGWRNPSAALSLAQAVSDPSSSSYGQYVSPAQFRQQFAPTQDQVSAVQRWLRSLGFTVKYTPQNNHYVSAEGTVGQAASAFDTRFGMYSVQGLTLRSPSSGLSIPSRLAGIVSGVIGLDDSAQFLSTENAGFGATPPAAVVTAQPCSSYWGEKFATGFTNPYGSGTLPYAPCGYTPQQIKGAYGIADSGLDGSDQTVAVIDPYASPTIASDLNQWSANRGVPQFQAGQLQQLVAPGAYRRSETGLMQNPQGWYREETLDIEAIHGTAPAANIAFVAAPDGFQDLDAALNHVVDQRLARIVSNSYGFPSGLLPPGYIQPYEDTFLQAACEGIGIYFASGNHSDGSLAGGSTAPDWPASSPFVTSVGGTSLAVGASNDYLFETGWGTSNSDWTGSDWSPTPPGTWIYEAGGGVSQFFAEPSYQQGAVQQGVFDTQGRTGRAVPDVAADSDPNSGYLIGLTQTFPDGTTTYSEYEAGGTGLGSALYAGVMALSDQQLGMPHGFANPALYAELGAFNDPFHDIVNPASTVAVVRSDYVNNVDPSDGLSYHLRTANQTLSLHTTPGYDDVTGLGTPTAALVNLP